MDDRYEVFDTLGKGVFSTVLRARDTAHKNALGKHPEVAVKVSNAHAATLPDKAAALPRGRLRRLMTQAMFSDRWAAVAPVAAYRHEIIFRMFLHPSKGAQAVSKTSCLGRPSALT